MRQEAIKGACWELASTAAAPSSAHAATGVPGNRCDHPNPNAAAKQAPMAMDGVMTPPDAPARIVSIVSTALSAASNTSQPARLHAASTGRLADVRKACWAAARPLPHTCGKARATAPVMTATSGNSHSIADPLAWREPAHWLPRRNNAPTAPHSGADSRAKTTNDTLKCNDGRA